MAVEPEKLGEVVLSWGSVPAVEVQGGDADPRRRAASRPSLPAPTHRSTALVACLPQFFPLSDYVEHPFLSVVELPRLNAVGGEHGFRDATSKSCVEGAHAIVKTCPRFHVVSVDHIGVVMIIVPG
jgi:hypothetical protein